MTLPFRRSSRRGTRHLTLTGDFPADEPITEVLGQLPDYDGATFGLPAPVPDTQPLGRLRAQPSYTPPAPDTTPDTLPRLSPRDTGPQQRLPRIARVKERPRPQRPADAAIFAWSRLLQQHIMKCGVCLRSRYADPIAGSMPFTFEALRVSAYVSGWRLDAFARWACPACQQTPAYWSPYPVIHWDGDAADAYLRGLPDTEFYHRAAAEHDLIRDVTDRAGTGRHRVRAS